MPTTPATCPLDCPDACGVLVETDAQGRFERVRGDPGHPWSRGTLCGKTALYGELVTSPDRLLEPLVRGPSGELEPASWEEAVARIAERVRPLRGEQILAAPYGGSMGFAARRFPLRMMHALGASFLDDSICDGAAMAGWELVLGRRIGADLDEIEGCDLFVAWGLDAARTMQHLLPRLRELARRGVPVVVLDVYRTETIERVERWGGKGLVLRPGSDGALALALSRLAFERGLADRGFLERECLGAREYEAGARDGHDLEWAARETGLEPGAIEELAERLGAARRPFVKLGLGFTRRSNGGGSMRAVCSMAAVFGLADRLHLQSSDAFGLDDAIVERPDLRPPGQEREPVTHAALGRELLGGRFRAIFVWGHNPAVTCPDALRVREALSRPDLLTVVHEQFLTETARLADVVLPAATFVEHADVYRSYAHRWLRYVPRAAAPPAEARSNVEAFAAIAKALELPRPSWDASAESVCEELLDASRERFAPGELDALRAGVPVKMRPPEPPGGGRGTPSGKVELSSERALALGLPAVAAYQPEESAGIEGAFRLHCAPSRNTHNSTFAHSPRHLRREGPPRAHLNPEDAAGLSIAEGRPVTLRNRLGRITLTAAVAAEMPRGMVRVDGLPRAQDVPEGVGINALLPGELSDLGGSLLYGARVDVEPVADGEEG